MKRTYTTILAAILAAPAAMLIASAPAQAAPIETDQAYQNYLRWNGFHVASTTDQSGATGMATKTDSSYQAYLRRNGFHVESSADQSGITGGEDGTATTTGADSSYQAYLRWNGFRS